MNNWIKKDLAYVWHPYTQMKDYRSMPPIFIESGRGIKLYDNKKNFYYDTISSWWCNVHGHNHPKIKAAIKKQLDILEHVLFAGCTHEPAVTLAERLISVTPRRLTKVFFSDDGSTAVEAALKMSYQYWHNTGVRGKKKFISLDYGYHGDTIGAMSVSNVGLFNEIFTPFLFRSFKVPSPYCYRCPMKKERASCDIDCIAPLEKLLKKRNREIAAMIIEPLIMAAGGMIVYPREYLLRAGNLTKRYGVHFIVDEIATGFGRTGRMFASDHAGIQPDIMCLSKGITSGYLPLGATVTTEKIYRAFYADYARRKTFYHGHTFTANPLSTSAASAAIDIFKKEHTLKKTEELIPLFHAGLERMRACGHVGDVRYLGLIGALELVKDKRLKTPFPFEERVGLRIYKEGFKKHLLLRPLGNIVYLFLPLCVSKEDLEIILDTTHSIIKAV